MAALKNHHTEYHSRFTNCTRHVNTKEGFQPRRTRGCVCERTLSCCALAACIPLLRHQRDRQVAGGIGRGPVSVYILNLETVRGKGLTGRREGGDRGSGRTVLCSMSFKGTVLSHDVNKELTGIAHSMLEGLATGGELRRNGC